VNQDLQLIDVARAQHDLITREDVRSCGLSSQQWCDRLDEGLWLPVSERVFRHRATPATWELRVRAAALSLGRDAALFGPTAAQWWGLDGFSGDAVEFVVPRIRRSLDPNVRIHTTKQWHAADLAHRDGVRTTSAVRTIIDLVSYATSGRVMRVDFEFQRLNLVVEVTGRLGHTSDRDRRKDALRRNALQQIGKEVLEFTTVDVLSSPDYVLATLHTSGVVTL